ncbi:TPA: DUF551 domain-containing protein [Yersinia enterocolitica]
MSRKIESLITALKAAAQEEIMLRESGDTSDRWQDDATPENVLRLVEALSAKQAEPVGWIKCSDSLPKDDQVVAIVDAGHGCFYGGAVVSRSGPNFHLIGGLSAENYDGGAVVELDMEATHWMPLAAAPTSLLEGESNG